MSDLDQRILDLLRAESAPLVPLTRIYRALQDDVGSGPRAFSRLRERVRRRPELFTLLEPEHPALDASWPLEVREEYEAALSAAGVELGPLVALAPGSDPNDDATPRTAHTAQETLQHLDSTLLGLWHSAASDATARADVLDAIREANELRRALGLATPT